MARKQVYSICGMCTVRCPIQVETEGGMAMQEHFVSVSKV